MQNTTTTPHVFKILSWSNNSKRGTRDQQVTPPVKARPRWQSTVCQSKRYEKVRGKTEIWPQINSREGLSIQNWENLQTSKKETITEGKFQHSIIKPLFNCQYFGYLGHYFYNSVPQLYGYLQSGRGMVLVLMWPWFHYKRSLGNIFGYYINEVWRCLLSLMGWYLIVQLSILVKVGLHLWEFSINKYKEHWSRNSQAMKLIEKTQCHVIHGVFRMQQTRTDVKCILQLRPACVELCKVLSHHITCSFTELENLNGAYQGVISVFSPTNCPGCPLFLEHLKR